jgi:hypothetical protein
VFDLLEENWNAQFDCLRQFKTHNGHCELFWATFCLYILKIPPLTLVALPDLRAGNVPSKYKKDPSLGNWVNNQRVCWKNGKMDLKWKKKLDDNCFDFAPRYPGKGWEESECTSNMASES